MKVNWQEIGKERESKECRGVLQAIKRGIVTVLSVLIIWSRLLSNMLETLKDPDSASLLTSTVNFDRGRARRRQEPLARNGRSQWTTWKVARWDKLSTINSVYILVLHFMLLKFVRHCHAEAQTTRNRFDPTCPHLGIRSQRSCLVPGLSLLCLSSSKESKAPGSHELSCIIIIPEDQAIRRKKLLRRHNICIRILPDFV